MERYLFKCNYCGREQLQESELELNVGDDIICKYCKNTHVVEGIDDEARRIIV